MKRYWKHLTCAVATVALTAAECTAQAQATTSAQLTYPGAVWPALKKLPKAEYTLSRVDFLQRYGVTDSAIAIIKLYFYQYKRGQQAAKQPTVRAGIGATLQNVHPKGENTGTIGQMHANRWEPEKLYRTLYELRTTGELPGYVSDRLPIYLDRLREQRAGAVPAATEAE